MLAVPFAKALDPVTKTNWEGTGVEPDVKVPAADALDTTEKLALKKIQESRKDDKYGLGSGGRSNPMKQAGRLRNGDL
jgi:C-terminal processing protease CtpA/Prc